MSELISRTGRVQSWMDDPEGRLPVSCTVFVVENEMKDPMESKRAGDLLVMLYAMERDAQSIYQGLTPEGTREHQGLWRLVQYHLGASIQALTKLSGEEVSTRMGQ